MGHMGMDFTVGYATGHTWVIPWIILRAMQLICRGALYAPVCVEHCNIARGALFWQGRVSLPRPGYIGSAPLSPRCGGGGRWERGVMRVGR